MSANQISLVAKAQWLPGGNQWYANFRVTLTNYGDTDVVNPTISFRVPNDVTVSPHSGEVTQDGTTVTAFLPNYQNTIAAGAVQELTVGCNLQGDGSTPPAWLPDTFTANGASIDPSRDKEAPTTPVNLRVGSASAASLALDWDAAGDNAAVAGYEVAYSAGDSAFTVRTVRPSVVLYQLTPATAYTVRVRAFDFSDNFSDRSAPLTGTTAAAPADHGDWDVPRAVVVNYLDDPIPQIAAYAKESGVDGFLVGSVTRGFGGTKKPCWVTGSGDGDDASQDATVSDFGKTDFTAFTEAGGTVVLSFGGFGEPLEIIETDVPSLTASYQGVLDNYRVGHLDFGFDGALLYDNDAQVRHVAAIGRLLQDNPALKLSYTLPADGDPTGVLGLTGESVRLLQRLAAAGIQPALINGALLGFGQGAPADVFDAVKNALNGMFTQLQAVWPDWDGAKVWRRIGACPMFGRNFSDKVFTLENMRRLAAFATERNIGCLSGWTANRDAEPGGQVRGTGVDQQPYDFTKIIATYQR